VRWLADECVSARLVSKLRELGHDVAYVVEVAPVRMTATLPIGPDAMGVSC
jgi:hypothetical protein